MIHIRRRPTFLSNLQQALLGCVALPLIIGSGLLIRVAFEQANTFQEALLKNDLELISRAIRSPVTEALLAGEQDRLESSLASVFSIGRVYGASVFDEQGRRIAAAGVTEQDLTGSRITRELAHSGQVQEAYGQVAGRPVYSHFTPLFDKTGKSRGFIQITRRGTDFTRSLETLTWLAWGIWAMLAAVIIATVLVGHYRGIGRHLNQLLQGMRDVAEGQLSRRFSVRGPKEVGMLANGLNQMLDGLQQRERELEDRSAAEQQLQLRLRDNESLATVGRITRGFAHELGAPLSVIDGRARRLGRQLGEHDRDLKAIRQQVHQLTRTVHDLLHYSRPAADIREQVDPLQLVRTCVAIVAEEQGGEPPLVSLGTLTAGPHPMDGDSRRLQLALLNVIRNAVQAGSALVEVSVNPRDGGTAIQVRDDGPGFPADRSMLIEPFHTTRASGEGTGLGLAITASIVKEHGGDLHLENASHGGGLVTLWFPTGKENTP